MLKNNVWILLYIIFIMFKHSIPYKYMRGVARMRMAKEKISYFGLFGFK